MVTEVELKGLATRFSTGPLGAVGGKNGGGVNGGKGGVGGGGTAKVDRVLSYLREE